MNRISTILLLTILLISFGSSTAQKKEYKYKFSAADFISEPDVNSKAEEIFPLYNRTYDTMYFVRSHHYDNIGKNKDNQDIWYTYINGGSWAAPVNLRELNNSHNNSIVGIGLETNSLFMINSYTSTVIRDQGIASSFVEDGKWTKPVPIDLAVDTQHRVYSFFINHKEDIIVITMYNNLSEGHEDLFVSIKSEDDRWRDPIYLGHDVNSEGFETSPFLADDTKTLFYTSSGFGGLGGGDVYMSKRLDDTWVHWSEPVNLGKNVNSEKFDGYFTLYDNNTYLLASNRHSEYADIFQGKWELEEIAIEEEKAPVVVREVIKEKSLMESLPEGLTIEFDFNSSVLNKSKYSSDLDAAVDYLKANDNIGIVLEGNTDSSGDDLYNLILSHKRATRVADYLKSSLPNNGKDRVYIQPNGELNATSDEVKSRVVNMKYVLLNN